MFYCDHCAAQKGWPFPTLMRSAGSCEICKKHAPCNDLASKDLPRAIPNEDEEECK